jgi:hypothetical protein
VIAMLSSRFAAAVVVLLVIAAVPTVIHSYRDSSRHDGRVAADLPVRLAGETGTPTRRRATWGEERLGSSDWTERTYGTSRPVKLFVGRSYDLKKLYHHPELAIDYGGGYVAHTVITLPQRPGVPVHMLRGGLANPERLALYALEYDGSYVADPIWFQLRTSVELLFSRRGAMTLFFANQDLRSEETPESSRAAVLLSAAMEAFEGQARQ